jgi:riboflavin kinase/FMN adenylyltransferase
MTHHPHVLSLDALDAVPAHPRVLAIGNFDGVHRGHQQLLAALAEPALLHAAPRCALTFHPHPAVVVAPQRAPQPLVSLDERIRLLHQAGAAEVLVLRFDEALSRLHPVEFVTGVLLQRLQARHIAIGANFRFGHGQQGDATTLADLGQQHGFALTCVPLLTHRRLPLSSSQIRQLIREGQVLLAARLLGRPLRLSGPVISGRGVGSKQTVPTLNLAPPSTLLPADGVYVTRVLDADTGTLLPGITNIGLRPTFKDGHPERSIETFVLGPLPATPAAMHLDFLHRLRDERRFDSPEALKSQILLDVARAQTLHRRLSRWRPSALQSL